MRRIGPAGNNGWKDLDAYSIGTTLRNDALLQKEKDPGSFTLPCYINNFCFEKALVDLGANNREASQSLWRQSHVATLTQPYYPIAMLSQLDDLIKSVVSLRISLCRFSLKHSGYHTVATAIMLMGIILKNLFHDNKGSCGHNLDNETMAPSTIEDDCR
ncbi:hypothetical protein Tco_1577889 [Tanacetum coccineum]